MTPLISEIKRQTQNMFCPEHNEKAEVDAHGDKVEFKCCCETFKAKLIAVSKEIATMHAKKTVTDMFKDAFKGSKYIKIK